MHLLQVQAGAIADGTDPVDLGQTPGDIVVLSAADTELANLAAAHAGLPGHVPSLRLANLMHLSHNLSVDLYLEQVVAHARLVVVRLLGGVGYWSYGVEQLADLCRARAIPLALLPGDDQPDAELAGLSSVPHEAAHRLWQYCVHGGPDNGASFLGYAAGLIGLELPWVEPLPLLRAGLYWPGIERPDLTDLESRWQADQPVAAIVFYRALVQAGTLAPVDRLIESLQAQGINPLPLFCSSLKDPVSAETLTGLLSAAQARLVLNCTGFAVSSPGAKRRDTPFDGVPGPILQVVFAGGTAQAWADGSQGLSARDIAMNVALPEVDGRILTRSASFKSEARYDPATQASVVTYAPQPDRIAFIAELAARWIALAQTPAEQRSLGIVLANYPNKDGRLGNGVGLDTPAGTLEVLRELKRVGYDVGELPTDGQQLIARLAAGPTNDLTGRAGRPGGERYALADYRRAFALLPATVQAQVIDRWGPPEDDPFVVGDAFVLSAFRLGKVVIGLQPGARLQHRPGGQLSRSGPGAAPRIPGVLCLDASGPGRPGGNSHGQARYPGVAAGQGALPIGGVLSRGRVRPLAPSLPLHRQRPGRGHPGQAPQPSGDHRSPDPAADPGRKLRPLGRFGAAGRRVL